MVFVYVYIKFIIIINIASVRDSCYAPCLYASLGCPVPSKSGLMNKHIVKHIVNCSELYCDHIVKHCVYSLLVPL